MNSFFDKSVSKKNTMMDLVTRFERAVRRQRHNKQKADHDSIDNKPHLKTNLEMEKQMQSRIHKGNFKSFKLNCMTACVMVPWQ